jgi:AcrR family transcriptional regulator
MSSARNAPAPRKARIPAEEVRRQIVDAFSSKAKAIGLRGVMMGELATELRISATTLYKHFPSKDALTLACVERWADELAATSAVQNKKLPAFEQFVAWIEAWAGAQAALSPAFVRDLESDYPAAYRRFRAVMDQRKQQGARLLRSQLKPELDERVAFAVLDMILTATAKPELADRLRISRHEAIRTAVTIWASGALDRRGKLKAMKTQQGRPT